MTFVEDTRPNVAGSPRPDDIVRVEFKGWENGDGRPLPYDGDYFIATWDSRNYKLDLDTSAFIPAAAAANSFGDWRSGPNVASDRDARGVVGFIPDRETEVRRLRMRYANHLGDDTSLQTFPLVDLYDLDGNKVTTVLDDPTGETITPSLQTVAGHEQMLAVINQQQVMLERLLRAANLSDKADAISTPVTPQDLGVPEEEPADWTEDGPTPSGQFGLPEDDGGTQPPSPPSPPEPPAPPEPGEPLS